MTCHDYIAQHAGPAGPGGPSFPGTGNPLITSWKTLSWQLPLPSGRPSPSSPGQGPLPASRRAYSGTCCTACTCGMNSNSSQTPWLRLQLMACASFLAAEGPAGPLHRLAPLNPARPVRLALARPREPDKMTPFPEESGS